MNRFLASAIACSIVSMSSPTIAGAQPDTTALTTEQVRIAFQQNLYDTDQPILWTSSGLTTVFVRDGNSNERLVLLLVYPDLETAQAEHRNAHAEEEMERGTQLPLDDDRGPPLLPGYGRSAWVLNVALLQASRPVSPTSVTNETDPLVPISTRSSRMHELATLQPVDSEFVSVVRSLVGESQALARVTR